MKIKNKGGYVVPVAIGALMLASVGLMLFSWWGQPKKQEANDTAKNKPATTTPVEPEFSTATDPTTMDADSTKIDEALKALDNSSADINNSLNDKSTI